MNRNTLAKAALALATVSAAASALALDPGSIKPFNPGSRFDAADIIRGAIPSGFFGPVKVGKCPTGTDTKFASGALSCTKDVAQFANVTCGNPAFPRYVALATGNGSERDVCAANTPAGRRIASDTNVNRTVSQGTCDAGDTLLQHSSGLLCLNPGVSIGANSNLANFAEGRNRDFYRATVTQVPEFKLSTDFERVPVLGHRNSFSYVQNVALNDVVNQGWTIDVTQPGATDKFKRIIKRRVSAILVDQQ